MGRFSVSDAAEIRARGIRAGLLALAAIGIGALTGWAAVAIAKAASPVERGAYLVNAVLACGNCHTPIGPKGHIAEKALSGGFKFDAPPFTVSASNITPDKKTGIGSWSDEEIRRAIVDGMRPDGTVLAPVMPYAFYKVISPDDLNAIVAYLRTLAPVENRVPAPDYKMAFEAEKVPGAERPIPASLRTSKAREGFYIATIAHCMECHTPREKGGLNFAAMGRGGTEFEGPWGRSVAANITAHKQKGLGSWSDAEIKRAISQGIGRDGRQLRPPMAFAFYAQMSEADLDALVAWLRTVPPQE